MNEEPKYIKGLFTSRREQAPDFLLASLSIKTEQFIEWLKGHTNARGYVNIDVLKSKEGQVYSKLNDWKPQEHFVKNQDGTIGVEEVEDDEIKIEDIPFN